MKASTNRALWWGGGIAALALLWTWTRKKAGLPMSNPPSPAALNATSWDAPTPLPAAALPPVPSFPVGGSINTLAQAQKVAASLPGSVWIFSDRGGQGRITGANLPNYFSAVPSWDTSAVAVRQS